MYAIRSYYVAQYEADKEFVTTIEEGQKLRDRLSKDLAQIDEQEASAKRSSALKAERSALREISATIKGYTARNNFV